MKTEPNAGLQSLALALIFMPEPFTTPIGIVLLAYARVASVQKPTVPRRVISTFEDQYSYKIKMVNGTAINFELSARRHGQIPRAYPSVARLQDNAQAMKALRARVKGQSAYTSIPFSKLEPAGLMRGPRLKDRAALASPRYTNPTNIISKIT